MVTYSVEIEKPWRVVSLDGGFLSGHDTEDQAKNRCEDANTRAKVYGIPTQYEVRQTGV